MAFYNAAGPRTNADSLGEHPLDIASVGGVFSTNLSVVTGGGPTILAAPVAGTLYRLHRFVSLDVVGGAASTAVTLLNGSTFLSVLLPQRPVDKLEGQLWATSLSVFNGTAGTVRVTLTWDLVGNIVVS